MIRRKDVPFSSLDLLFGGFILFRDIGHLLEAIIFFVAGRFAGAANARRRLLGA